MKFNRTSIVSISNDGTSKAYEKAINNARKSCLDEYTIREATTLIGIRRWKRWKIHFLHTPWTTGRSPSQCDAFRIIDFRLFFVFGWWPFKISTHVGASCTRFTTHHHITTAYHIRRKWKKNCMEKKG